MGPAKLACFNSQLSREIVRRQCTEGTRKAILSEVDGWCDDPDAQPIYWMDGMAGTGKTTIACTLSALLDARGQLGASFFCTSTSAECQDANRILPTIAYQLACQSTPYQSALCQALEKDKHVCSLDISVQFERLLKAPLLEVKDRIPRNLVVAIDALDECKNPKAVRAFLDALIGCKPRLPLKFFIASRPEPIIYDRMTSQSTPPIFRLELQQTKKSPVQDDIQLYLQRELASISPSDDEITKLTWLADDLFIYAATTVRYILPDDIVVDPRERLATIVNMKTHPTKLAAIDRLYSTILADVLDAIGLEPKERERIQLVLWTIACAQAPLALETLAILAELETTHQAWLAVQPLRSVVHVSGHKANALVSILHASFLDYLFNREHSKEFYCNRSEHNSRIACQCLTLMKDQLPSSPYEVTRREYDEFPTTLTENPSNVPQTLSYACHYWLCHLALARSHVGELPMMVHEFFAYRSLSWARVLRMEGGIYDSIIGKMLNGGITHWLNTYRVSSRRLLTCE